MRRYLLLPIVLFCGVFLLPAYGLPRAGSANPGLPCPRYASGSTLVEPKDLFSSHGVLRVEFLLPATCGRAGQHAFLLFDAGRDAIADAACEAGG